MNLNNKLIVAFLLVFTPLSNIDAQSIAAFNNIDTNVQRSQLHQATRAQLKTEFIDKVNSHKNEPFSILFPDENGNPMIIDFKPYEILSEDFVLTDQNRKRYDFEKPQFFKGELKGGFATMTVFKDRISAVISIKEKGNIHIAQDKQSKNPNEYWIYNDHDWKNELSFECHTVEEDNPIPKEAPTDLRSVDQCVEVYLEADYFMFEDYITTQAVMNYLAEVWVHVAALYEAEDITVNISEIFVWTSNDPYSDINAGDALLSFAQTRPSFNGDIAHLVSTNPANLGGISFLDVLCTDAAYGFSNITNNYSPLPSYSWTINLLAHEIGHQLGSPHTHSCSWPNGPIDDCAPVEGGPCNPGPTPTNGGTIMSYCHLTGIGIDFNNGFGPVVGNHIRAKVAGATCLAICDDGGGSGNNAPNADFLYTYVSPCQVGVVSFENASTGNPTTYSWQFEGGIPSSSLDENPVVQYLSSGLYSVTLTVSNANGIDTEIKNDVINIQDDPTVSTSFSNPNGPNTFQFNGIGVGISSWLWEFGDGSSSTLQNPIHTYNSSGTYNVSLTASNACGTAQSNFSVSVDLPPIAAFSQNKTSGCAPLNINYLNQSLNNPTDFNWQLQGGTPSTSDFHSPFVTYQTPGVFDVILQVSNASGFDTEIKQNLITVEAGPIPNFIESINGATVTFTNASINFNSVLWDFGDGSMSTTNSPTHTYLSNGSYIVTQTVDNDCGSEVLKKTITISAYPEPGFSLQSADGCAPHTVNFINESINSDNVSWQFSGGSPSSSSSNNPAVVYQSPGVYDVIMTVSNTFGAVTETYEEVVSVGAEPIADFVFDNVGLNYSFENQSLYADSYMWDFGDGNFSTEESPQHNFAVEGTYDVVLEITGLCGTATTEITLTIFNLPSAIILAGPTEYCVGDPVRFNTNISSNAEEFEWTITGPETLSSDEEDPIFYFTTPGVYSVQLEVSNPAGSDVEFISSYLTIQAEPSVDFTFDVNILQVSFQAQISQANSVLWSFGDGTSSTQFHPTHQYAANGDYLVSLVATNDCGGTSFSETIILDQLTFANFSADQTAFCQGEFVQFQNNSTMSADEFSWSFPGGTPDSSNEENPLIFYDVPGVYDVSLHVDNGITDDQIFINNYIQVDANEAFEIENVPLIAYIPTNIRFNAGNNVPGNYQWDFGDGDQSNVASPIHQYENEGSYQVTLNYDNSCFELDTTFLLHVYSRPQPDFVINNNTGCAPFTVNVNNLSLDNYSEIEWTSTGSVEQSSTMEEPVFTYLQAGQYDVTLTLKNPLFEESFTIQNVVDIIDVPVADFSYNENNFVVNFNDASIYNASQTWDFGDGEISNQQNPTHTYDEEGSYTVSLEAKNICGSDEIDQLIHLYTRPNADFVANELVACLPANISFDNLSSDNSLEFEWIFEGANVGSSTEKEPVITYDQKGIFDVVLVVSNPLFKDTLTLANYITINDVSEAAFDFEQSGLEFQFNNLSNDAVSYHWDFGDGTTSQEVNPAHDFAMPGNYFISLTTTNACGNNTTNIPVEVRNIPAANFSVNQLKQCAGSDFTFFNLSDVETTDYEWIFPGTAVGGSTDEAPVVTYNTPGIYDVTLIAHSSFGSDTVSFENYIEVQSLPVASFELELIGNALHITNNSISADDYLWIAGSQASTDENPIFSAESNGDVTVELTVSNSCGSDMVSRTTTVNALPVIDFRVTERACLGEVIVFESLSTNVDNHTWYVNGEIIGTTTDSVFEMSFDEAGVYEVLLVGVNQFGQTELRKEQAFEIVGQPVADFEFSFFGDQILFTDLSQFGVDYFWDFGDGFISITGGDQFHLFAQAGIYEIKLMVENECGSDTIILLVDANILLPQPLFFSNHDLCVPTDLDINNETTGDITSWYWRLSGPDTIESFLETPILNIVKPGSYDLYLEFANQYGGVSEFFESYVFIQDIPEAGVEISVEGLQLAYANVDDASDEYFWDFGDGNNANVKNGVHQFAESGNYELTHRASNVCGESSFTENLNVQTIRTEEGDVIESITLQPNPTTEGTNLEIRAYISEPFEIQIMNSLGQLIKTIEHPPINGSSNVYIGLNTNRFTQGVYHIWIKAGDYRKSVSIVRI